MSQEYAIELKKITKRVGKVTDNDKVCLSVRRGEILSILGENGSGKTPWKQRKYGESRAKAGSPVPAARMTNPESPYICVTETWTSTMC